MSGRDEGTVNIHNFSVVQQLFPLVSVLLVPALLYFLARSLPLSPQRSMNKSNCYCLFLRESNSAKSKQFFHQWFSLFDVQYQ